MREMYLMIYTKHSMTSFCIKYRLKIKIKYSNIYMPVKSKFCGSRQCSNGVGLTPKNTEVINL